MTRRAGQSQRSCQPGVPQDAQSLAEDRKASEEVVPQSPSGFLPAGDKDRSGDGVCAESVCFSFLSPILHNLVTAQAEPLVKADPCGHTGG